MLGCLEVVDKGSSIVAVTAGTGIVHYAYTHEYETKEGYGRAYHYAPCREYVGIECAGVVGGPGHEQEPYYDHGTGYGHEDEIGLYERTLRFSFLVE